MDSWFTSHGVRWALVAMLLCVIVGLPLRRGLNRPSASEVKITDAALLDQIDNELSRAAPHRMEPLLNLVSSDGGQGPDAPE